MWHVTISGLLFLPSAILKDYKRTRNAAAVCYAEQCPLIGLTFALSRPATRRKCLSVRGYNYAGVGINKVTTKTTAAMTYSTQTQLQP